MSKRICFIGPPGSGKSTLAAEVFTAMKQAGASVELCDEFVRRDIQRNGILRSIWEQYRTRQHQKELEDVVPDSVDWVICDSGTISPYFYATLYADHADARQRLVLQDLFRYLLDDLYLRRYEMIFYLPNRGLHEDGTRFQTEDDLRVLDEHMDLVFTKLFRVGNAHRLDMPLSDRLGHVLSVISQRK